MPKLVGLAKWSSSQENEQALAIRVDMCVENIFVHP